MKINDTINFVGKSYKVVEIHGACAEAVKQLGIIQQVTIEGQRGAQRLLQIFNNGTKRTISLSGRTEIEYSI